MNLAVSTVITDTLLKYVMQCCPTQYSNTQNHVYRELYTSEFTLQNIKLQHQSLDTLAVEVKDSKFDEAKGEDGRMVGQHTSMMLLTSKNMAA